MPDVIWYHTSISIMKFSTNNIFYNALESKNVKAINEFPDPGFYAIPFNYIDLWFIAYSSVWLNWLESIENYIKLVPMHLYMSTPGSFASLVYFVEDMQKFSLD